MPDSNTVFVLDPPLDHPTPGSMHVLSPQRPKLVHDAMYPSLLSSSLPGSQDSKEAAPLESPLIKLTLILCHHAIPSPISVHPSIHSNITKRGTPVLADGIYFAIRGSPLFSPRFPAGHRDSNSVRCWWRKESNPSFLFRLLEFSGCRSPFVILRYLSWLGVLIFEERGFLGEQELKKGDNSFRWMLGTERTTMPGPGSKVPFLGV